MEDPHYRIQSADSSHNSQLQFAIESLDKGDSDLAIITKDGEKIETHKSLICLYSKTVISYLNSIPCCRDASISLPVSSFAFYNLLKVLSLGVVKVDVKELSEVTEAAKILGIDLQNIYLESANDVINLGEASNGNIKTEPGIDEGRVKKKVKKMKTKKTQKRKQIRQFKTESDEEKVYVEQLLQEDVALNQRDNLDDVNWKEATKCSQCEKIITNKFQLIKPMLIHTKDKSFDCTQCGKIFINIFLLKQHVLTHTQDNPFDCEKCGNMFISKSQLKRHMFIHTTEKPFPCDQCGKSFATRYLLSRHEITHTSEKPFACYQCGKCFSRNDQKIRHQYKNCKGKK